MADKVSITVTIDDDGATCLHCWLLECMNEFNRRHVDGDAHYVAVTLGLVVSDIIRGNNLTVEQITAFLSELCQNAVAESGGVMNIALVQGATPKAEVN